MMLLLVFAFFQSETLGLGLEIDLGNTVWGETEEGSANTVSSTIAVFVLLLAMLIRGIMSLAPSRGAEEPKTMKWIIDVVIYFLIVGLFIYLQVWEWSTASIIFIGIWIMAFISGSAGDQDSRQTIGVILIVASFVIFSMGIGTQIVGEAFFGQWFPTVYQGIASVTGPLADIFDEFGAGFRNAFLLITNPTEYAQSIMNGSYQKDPDTGVAGAYGVEIMETKLTPIYAEQPYQALIKIQNKGAFTAKNVMIKLMLGEKAPTDKDALNIMYDTATLDETLRFFSEDKDGDTKITEKDVKCEAKECSQSMDFEKDNELTKIDLRQVFFKSSGIKCKDVVAYKMMTKFLPLQARVEYDYSIDSSIELEFISKAEWDRLVKEGTIQTQVKKPAQLKNAPVRLNLDTLEQPVREGTDHFIGIHLDSSKKNGKISGLLDEGIVVEFPTMLGAPICSPEPVGGHPVVVNDVLQDKRSEGGVLRLEWKEEDVKEKGGLHGNYLIYCNLPGLDFEKKEISGPYQTFIIKASASYAFVETKGFLPGKMEFGGIRCCDGDELECLAGQICNEDNTCGEPGEDFYLDLAEEMKKYAEEKSSKLSADLDELMGMTHEERVKLKDEFQVLKDDIDKKIKNWESATIPDDLPEIKKLAEDSIKGLESTSGACTITIYCIDAVEFYLVAKSTPSIHSPADVQSKIADIENTISYYSGQWDPNKYPKVKNSIDLLEKIKAMLQAL